MDAINRQWLLRRRPQGAVSPDDFAYAESTVSLSMDLAPGEMLLQNRVFLCAPTMRNWMNPPGSGMYLSIGIGEPVSAPAACIVVASARPECPAGSQVTTFSAWQDYQRVSAEHPVTKVPDGLDLTAAMGVVGVNALTAYFGMLRVGQITAGQTVLVSGAAGSTGSTACQIAKIHGCRVIGIAGGARKCGWLLDDLHLDGAVDYKSGNVLEQLRALCPQGVNVFFDNVGGDILQAAVEVMARKGRIVLCGQIASYNETEPSAGLRNTMRLVYGGITVQGFVQRDYADEALAAREQLSHWLSTGQLRARVDARPGFMQIPETFCALFRGDNDGTLLALVD